MPFDEISKFLEFGFAGIVSLVLAWVIYHMQTQYKAERKDWYDRRDVADDKNREQGDKFVATLKELERTLRDRN